MSDKKVKIIVRGFETKEQASEWASWYSGQGEQDWFIWQGENGGIDGQTDSIENDDLTDKDIILNLRRK